MNGPILVLVSEEIDPEDHIDARELCKSFAGFLGAPVELAVAPQSSCEAARIAIASSCSLYEEVGPVRPVSASPMSSAQFVWGPDGRPDWAAMWTGFCELALYGGPPHRGEDSALLPVDPGEPAGENDIDAIAEIRRGIFETTGLFAEPTGDGWVAVTCSSRKMAAWLCASTILENVEARFDEERLLMPAGPSFKLRDEVKSVITVLAKTHHYWQAHVLATEGATAAG